MNEEINIESEIEKLFNGSEVNDIRRKLQSDIGYYGICVYKTNENGTIKYVDPISEEGLKAQEQYRKLKA
jgi:hypothetical protein